jgi:hypothetical protein
VGLDGGFGQVQRLGDLLVAVASGRRGPVLGSLRTTKASGAEHREEQAVHAATRRTAAITTALERGIIRIG